MLSRTADHLFWMSRYTERAGDMPQAIAGMTDNCAQRLSGHHQNMLARGSARRCLRPEER
jgi:uncharacterized alpha-E superfamily protein